MKKIFISYRREDTWAHANSLHNALKERFGKEHVFMDTADKHLGSNWHKRILSEISDSFIMLVIIGNNFIKEECTADEDYVLVEISEALNAGIKILPVLVGNTNMPNTLSNSPVLKKILEIDALRLYIDNKKYYEMGLRDLLIFIEGIIDDTVKEKPTVNIIIRRPWKFYAGGLSILIEFYGGIWKDNFVVSMRGDSKPFSTKIRSGEYIIEGDFKGDKTINFIDGSSHEFILRTSFINTVVSREDKECFIITHNIL